MTQYQLLKKQIMTRRIILQIETHKKGSRLSNAYKIAKALNKDIDEVFVLVINLLNFVLKNACICKI